MGYNVYLKVWQVEKIYERLKGSCRGITVFRKEAKKIATFDKKERCYLFKDEQALWLLLREDFTEILEKKGITDWGHLMQYIS